MSGWSWFLGCHCALEQVGDRAQLNRTTIHYGLVNITTDCSFTAVAPGTSHRIRGHSLRSSSTASRTMCALFKEVRGIPGVQGKVAVLVAIGFTLGAIPVYMHWKDPDKNSPYAAAKKIRRAERLEWMLVGSVEGGGQGIRRHDAASRSMRRGDAMPRALQRRRPADSLLYGPDLRRLKA